MGVQTGHDKTSQAAARQTHLWRVHLHNKSSRAAENALPEYQLAICVSALIEDCHEMLCVTFQSITGLLIDSQSVGKVTWR